MTRLEIDFSSFLKSELNRLHLTQPLCHSTWHWTFLQSYFRNFLSRELFCLLFACCFCVTQFQSYVIRFQTHKKKKEAERRSLAKRFFHVGDFARFSLRFSSACLPIGSCCWLSRNCNQCTANRCKLSEIFLSVLCKLVAHGGLREGARSLNESLWLDFGFQTVNMNKWSEFISPLTASWIIETYPSVVNSP